MTVPQTVRTRFAPSPTGALHLGNVRAAIFNWLFARRHGGAFVLRLEDTDVVRNVAGAEEALMDDLRWLGLEWDEGPDVGGPFGPYRQSERGELYRAAAARLLESGAAYRCFCPESPEGDEGVEPSSDPASGAAFRRYDGRCRALEAGAVAARVAAGEAYVVRLATPVEGGIGVDDAIRGHITVPAADVDDFVLLRRDGRATYNFAVVVDDVGMHITHVIRGAGHLSNTPKQALLFDALGAPRPVFAHLPQVLAPEGGKLSKRSGATSVAQYRRDGHLPEAIVNYVSLLGWSHPEGREVLDVADLIDSVDLARVGASDTAFDPEKLRWIGSQHLAELDLPAVVAGVSPFLDAAGEPFANWTPQQRSVAVSALRSRLGTFGEIREHLGAFGPDPAVRQAAAATVSGDPAGQAVVAALLAVLPGADGEWTAASLKEAIREAGVRTGAKGPALYHPIRLAISGDASGPDLGAILEVIGREEALRRFKVVV